MKLYKGFDKNMKCCNFQYEEGKTYTHPGIPKICDEGFHACEVPLDCLKYYAPADGSIYREVEMEGVTDEHAEDSKRVGKAIKIGAKLSIRSLVLLSIHIIKQKTEGSPAATSKYKSTAATSGDYSSAATLGYYSTAATSGDKSTAVVEGKESIALAGGYKSMAKGALGCWLVLAERDDENHILGVKAIKVDGGRIKADTFYMLKDGEVVDYE